MLVLLILLACLYVGCMLFSEFSNGIWALFLLGFCERDVENLDTTNGLRQLLMENCGVIMGGHHQDYSRVLKVAH